MGKLKISVCVTFVLMFVPACRSAQKIERGVRYAAADEVVRYMEKQKQFYVDAPCEGKDQYFEQVVAEVRQLIVKE